MNVTPFWRAAPFNEHEKELWTLLMEAHHQSAFRENVSSYVVRIVASGAGDYSKAISAAVSSVGGLHAPLAQTMSVLQSSQPDVVVQQILSEKKLVPGWGSSFVKGQIDPLWSQIDAFIGERWPESHDVLDLVTRTLHVAGKKLYPNPSAYTALVAIILGVPAGVAPFLFITGRLAAWTELAAPLV